MQEAGNDLVRFCAEHLPRYMIPGTIEVRRSLPKTSTGKIDRGRLLADGLQGELRGDGGET
jgi:acyl-CoA synthetase (AMP-forming)/AMP-acid ligase II